MALEGLEQATNDDKLLDAARAFELANKAYFLYINQNPREQGDLLKKVLSNCAVDGASLSPIYGKPFDPIFQRARIRCWRRGRDSNPRYPFRYGRFRGGSFQPLTHLSAPRQVRPG